MKLAPSLCAQGLSTTSDYINSPELELDLEELAGQTDLFAVFVSLLISYAEFLTLLVDLYPYL